MTATTDWRTLPAGRELDALIAERVMGWSDFHRVPDISATGSALYGRKPVYSGGPHLVRVPAYSTDIAAAWLVVEKLEADGMRVTYRTAGVRERRVEITGVHPVRRNEWLVGEEAATAALAICHAALAAMEAA